MTMNTPLFIGIDVGNTGCRASCIIGNEVVAVPVPPLIAHQLALVVLQSDDCHPFGVRIYNVKNSIGSGRVISYHNRQFTADSVVREQLQALREISSTYLGAQIEGAVISVPPGSADGWRRRLIQIAYEAGYSRVGLVSDAVAATVAYTADSEQSKTVLVYGFGIYGFECSLLRYARRHVRELGSYATEEISGRGIEESMMQSLFAQAEQLGHTLGQRAWPSNNWLQLFNAVEGLKIKLGRREEAEIWLGSPIADDAAATLTYTREQLRAIAGPKVDLTLQIVDRIIDEAGLQRDNVSSVLALGGNCHLQDVRERLLAAFPGRVIFAPEDLLARGASLVAQRDPGLMEPPPETVHRMPPAETVSGSAAPQPPPSLSFYFSYIHRLIDRSRIEEARGHMQALIDQCNAVLRTLE